LLQWIEAFIENDQAQQLPGLGGSSGKSIQRGDRGGRGTGPVTV